MGKGDSVTYLYNIFLFYFMSKAPNVPIFSSAVGWLIWKEKLLVGMDLGLIALPIYLSIFL